MFKRRPLFSCVTFLARCLWGVFTGDTRSGVKGYRVFGPMGNEVRSFPCVMEKMPGFVRAGNALGVKVVGGCFGKLVVLKSSSGGIAISVA